MSFATGSFKAHAVGDVEGIVSSKKGSEGVRVMIQLDDGPDKGATIEWKGWLGENTMQRTAESLALMGYDGSNPGSVHGGKVFIAVIEKETYDVAGADGALKTYERPVVRWINDPSGPAGGFEPMDKARFSAVQDRLKAAMLASKRTVKPADPADEPRF